MTKAIMLSLAGITPKIGECQMCKKYKVLNYTLKLGSNVLFCAHCYCNIPEHISFDQDTQYIKLHIKRNNGK